MLQACASEYPGCHTAQVATQLIVASDDDRSPTLQAWLVTPSPPL